MPSTTAPIPKLFLAAVALDPEDDISIARHVVEQAAALTGAVGAGLTLVHMEVARVPRVPAGLEAPAVFFETMKALAAARAKEVDAALEVLRRSAEERGVATTAHRVDCIGAVADALVTEARRAHADVIVVCKHGRRGLQRLLLGSVAERVVRISPIAVHVLPPP